MTCAEACPVKPRESVQVAPTVAEPAEAPAVLKVAVFPLPDTEPPVEVQFATETGTPSGLVQVQVMLAEPPITRGRTRRQRWSEDSSEAAA